MISLVLALAVQVAGSQQLAGVGAASGDLLVGSWVLVSREDRTADGTVVPELSLGSDPLGFLVYDRTGHVAVQLMRRVRSTVGVPSVQRGQPDPNNSGAADGYDAYFGTYTLDPKAHTVTHHMLGALIPGDVGKSLTRHVAVSERELRLWFDTVGSSGKPVTRTLVWRRAESVK